VALPTRGTRPVQSFPRVMQRDAVRSGFSLASDVPGTGSSSEPGPRVASWRVAGASITLDRPRIMGILNVTPDSFWDGGRFADEAAALRQAESMVAAGADLIDVGGESTRPGARPIPVEEELARVLPVVRACGREWPDLPISVDTVKAAVAAAALDEGASVVNDVSGFRLDPHMARVCADGGAGVVLMHSRGSVAAMASYETAVYGADPVSEVVAELGAAAARARAAGIAAHALVLDPGLGFSKRTEHSAALLRELDRILALGYPVLLGPSRKRFVGELAGGVASEERLPGTIAACVVGWIRGARLFRVHDVAAVRSALQVAHRLAG
jgi:dihydropteroate synthase